MKPKINFRQELKIWGIYFATFIIAAFIHEFGHCVPAWINGYSAIPTIAKEYITRSIPSHLKLYISLGGSIASVAFLLGIISYFLISSSKYKSTGF